MPFLGLSTIVANGTRVGFANVAAGATTPVAYPLTVTTNASAAATTISLQAATAGLKLQHDQPIYFSNGVIAYVNTSGNTDLVTVATSATNVPVRPLSAAVPTTATTTAYNLRRLFGVRDCSVPIAPQPEDVFSMDDGFGIVQNIVGVERSANLSGVRKTGDRAMQEILVPYLTLDTTIRGFLWTDMLFPNGDHFSGLVRITGGNGFANGAVRTSMNYSMTLTFQGDAGFFYENAAESALLTA